MDERIKEKLINRAKTNPYVNFLGIDFTVIEEVGEQIFRHLLCGPSPSIEKMLLIYQYHEDFKCKKNPLRLPVVRRYVAGIQPAGHESPPDHPCG